MNDSQQARRVLQYRADINGLRAVAVLAVVVNHLDIRLFSGGYLGVDVFFVISGYLISGIIYAEVKSGDFSISRFYERRIRRILPAMAAVFLATLILAYVYFFPFELQNYAKSLLAATFCVSNMYFWTQSGYFEALATEKPLLHTWSLSVEEQFYLFFPLILLLAYRLLRHKLRPFMIVLFCGSLAVGALGAYYRPAAAFYLAPTRAWELLMGALISMEILPEIPHRAARNAAALLGVCLIAGSIVGYSADTLYPGLASMVPCLGAALILSAGRSGGSFAGAVLSARPMVFIGLISYSLYLWHWPIIVFHRMGFISVEAVPPIVEKAILIAVSIIVAALSWKYVESPFRNKTVSAQALYKFALCSVAILVLPCAAIFATRGLPYRFPAAVIQVASYLDYDAKTVARDGTCFLTITSRRPFDEPVCLHEEIGKKNDLLLGDSHAAHLWYGLSTAFPDINVMQATSAGCKPTVDPGYHEDKRRCRKLMDYIFDDFLLTHKVDTLFIESIWREGDLTLLPRTLDYAKAHADKVVLFGPMVQYDAALPRLLAVSMLKGDSGYPARHRLDFLVTLDAQMAALARAKNVTYVSFFQLLCGRHDCETTVGNGVPLLYDYGHLTTDGSLRVATGIRDGGILDR